MRLDEFQSALRAEAEHEPVDVDRSMVEVLERARRRSRRRVALVAGAALAAAVLVAASVTLVADREATEQVVAAGVGPETLIALTAAAPAGPGEWSNELLRLDVLTRGVERRAVPHNNYGEYPVPLLVSGARVLLPGPGALLSAPLDLATPHEAVAPALVFVPSAHPGRVWTVSQWEPGNRGPYVMTEVAADGRPTGVPGPAPPDAWWPVAAVGTGVVFHGPGDVALVWDPISAQTTRQIPGVPALAGGGWGAGTRFAWLGPCQSPPACERLHVLDIETGDALAVDPPPGTRGFVPDGKVSPDGSTLAVFAGDRDGARRLVLVDLASGAVTPVPAPARDGSLVTWSPGGTALYFASDDATSVNAYRVGNSSSEVMWDGLPRLGALVATDPASSGTTLRPG